MVIEVPRTDKVGECRSVKRVTLYNATGIHIGGSNIFLDEGDLAEVVSFWEVGDFFFLAVWQVFCDPHVARSNDEEKIASGTLVNYSLFHPVSGLVQ